MPCTISYKLAQDSKRYGMYFSFHVHGKSINFSDFLIFAHLNGKSISGHFEPVPLPGWWYNFYFTGRQGETLQCTLFVQKYKHRDIQHYCKDGGIVIYIFGDVLRRRLLRRRSTELRYIQRNPS
jgi:hypothetical protein